MTSSISIERQSRVIAAILTGVDISSPLDDEAFATVHDALMEHGVICLRGNAAATPADQLEFAKLWGEVSIHPYVPSIDGYPGLMRIHNPTPLTQTWHSDTTHVERPPSVTILLARVLPSLGGDTMFSSAFAAYERLSPGLQETLGRLRAVHQGTELAYDAGVDREKVTNTHPIVRTHPVTGRKALFVNGDYTSHIDGWTPEESQPLLDYLYARFQNPENTYRHRWQVGDVVIWDNRSVQHAVVGDTGGEERELHRVTVAGDVPQ